MLSLLVLNGSVLEDQAFEALDVRTGGYLRPQLTDRKLRPENLYGFPVGP